MATKIEKMHIFLLLIALSVQLVSSKVSCQILELTQSRDVVLIDTEKIFFMYFLTALKKVCIH